MTTLPSRFAKPFATTLATVTSVGRALRYATYRTYAWGSVVSLTGTWIHRVALGWLTWELTESGAWLGAVAFADLLPSVVIGPIAGVIADRVRRVRLLMATQAASLVVTAILAALVWTEVITIELLLLNTLLLGIAVGFAQPARLALVPSLVPRDALSAAIGFNSLIFNAGRLVGPIVAGAVIVGGGAALAFALNAASFAVFLVALWRLDRTLPATERRQDGRGEGRESGRIVLLITEILDGVRYATRHAGIAPLLVLFAITSIFGRPFTELLAGIAAQLYSSGAEGLAALTAASGVGALSASAMMARRSGAEGTTRLIVHHVALLSAAVVVLVATDYLPVGLLASAIAGYAMVVCAVGTQILIQLAVSGAMRGRVLSLYGLIIRGGIAIGALLMGGLSEFWGMAPPLALGAGLCVLAYGWAVLRLDKIASVVEGQPTFDKRAPAPGAGGAVGRR